MDSPEWHNHSAAEDPRATELALALLARHVVDPMRIEWPSYRPRDELLVVVGKLPEGLLLPRPLPDVGPIICSIVRRDSGALTIFLEDPRSAQEVVNLYDETLRRENWDQISKAKEEARGFMPIESQYTKNKIVEDVWYSSADREYFLQVEAYQYSIGPSDVRIDLVQDREIVIIAQATPGPAARVTPMLAPPPFSNGLTVRGGLRWDDTFSQIADLITRIDITGVAEHYEHQLREAGWAQEMARREEMMQWSRWRLISDSGSNWSCRFSVLARPWEPMMFLLEMSIDPG